MFGFLRRKRVTQKTDEEAFVPCMSHLDISEKEHPRSGARARPEEDAGETETRCTRVQSPAGPPVSACPHGTSPCASGTVAGIKTLWTTGVLQIHNHDSSCFSRFISHLEVCSSRNHVRFGDTEKH